MDLIPYFLVFTVVLVGFLFRKKQEAGANGGSIAISKTLWLSYVINAWFILPLYFIYSEYSMPFKMVVASLCFSMWIRGLIELAMLYKFKNWKPIYGIFHNTFTLALVLFAYLFNKPDVLMEKIYLGSLILSLCLEIYYANFFHKNLKEKTQGDEAIWFANKEDPLYRKNLLITTIGNTVLYTILFIFLY